MKNIEARKLAQLHWGGLFGSLLVIGWLYLPGINNGLVWDDMFFLRGRPEYWVPGLWWEAISQHFILSVNYFRPLVVGLFLFDSHFLGGSDEAYHVTNVVIFLVSCALVYLILHQLLVLSSGNPIWALAGVFLYGVSPLLSEVVLWVSGRFDLTVNLFLLLMLCADLRLSGRLRILGVFIAYLGAALSKEMAVTFGLIYPLWHYYVARIQGGSDGIAATVWKLENRNAYIAVIAAGLVYLVLRQAALGGLYYSETIEGLAEASITWELLALKTLGSYCLVVLGFATNISPVYPLPESVSWGDTDVLVGAAVIFALVICLIKKSLYGVTGLVFLVALFPVLNILPLNISGNYMHLRFLVVPYTLLIVMVFPLAFGRREMRWLWIIIVLCLIGSLTVRSIIPMWKSDYILWSWVSDRYPHYSLAKVNLVSNAVGRGEYKLALELGEPLLDGGDIPKTRRVFLYTALAEAYFQLGQPEKMLEQYERVFSEYAISQLRPVHYSRIYSTLARSLMVIDQDPKSVPGLLELSLKLDPYNDLALFLSGVIAYKEGHTSGAVSSINQSLRFMKDDGKIFVRGFLEGEGMLESLENEGLRLK